MPPIVHAGLPEIDSQTLQFLYDPNSVLGSGADRVRAARAPSGPVEFFSYLTVRGIFRDERFEPRSPQYYLDQGVEGGPILDFLVSGNLSLTWPDVHDRLRPILVRGFRPARIKQARIAMRELAIELVDGLATRSTADVVQDFSHHFSIGVISSFIGIPRSDVGEFDEATVDLRLLGQKPFWPGVPRLEAALEKVRDYSEKIVEQRRAHRREDLISDLITLQEQEGDMKISEHEIVWNVAGILLAGHDTTRYQLAACVRTLVEGDLWERVAAEPALITGAVNEAMRIHPATPRQVRVVREDLELDGVPLRAGDVVLLNLTAAGRDPAVFDRPDQPNLERTEAYDIGFGFGAHYCLGFAVAKAEMEVALEVLPNRLTDVALTAPPEIDPRGVIAGIDSMPVSYRAR